MQIGHLSKMCSTKNIHDSKLNRKFLVGVKLQTKLKHIQSKILQQSSNFLIFGLVAQAKS